MTRKELTDLLNAEAESPDHVRNLVGTLARDYARSDDSVPGDMAVSACIALEHAAKDLRRRLIGIRCVICNRLVAPEDVIYGDSSDATACPDCVRMKS